MAVIDVTRAYEAVQAKVEHIDNAVQASIDSLRDLHPQLADSVTKLLCSDSSRHSIFRLLPIPILGALGEESDRALPCVVASRIWWTGAEVFDDLSDGQYDATATGLSAARAGVASAACLSLVPLAVLDRADLPPRLKSHWAHEFVDSSLRAAEGQLSDVSSLEDPISWTRAMRSYAGKSGAPYGRDAAMTALLAGAADESIYGWRVFGTMFGVMRQLANDRAADSAETDEDLINGTCTLLVAHAADGVNGTAELQTLSRLRTQAQSDAAARVALDKYLRRPNIAATYNQRIRSIQQQLGELLQSLAPPSDEIDFIRWMIDVTARTARVSEDVK
ncbi:hypothetical protein ABZS96_44115 [Streptomyces avermitilis]|uniref:hypothetical protein n=1 Tax=Streptomyces avermitilis TaxID=33903 RepID=UPI00339FD0F7